MGRHQFFYYYEDLRTLYDCITETRTPNQTETLFLG